MKHNLFVFFFFFACTFAYPQVNIDYSLVELPRIVKSDNDILVQHIGYTALYNIKYKIPNWVAYQLTYEESLGTVDRKKIKFFPDPQVGEYASPKHEDYTNSGFARGHMAPAGDMKWSEKAMIESFYLSNTCPQDQKMNSGVWNTIEIHIRKMISKWGAVYICCGPIVKDNYKTIGENKIAVPSAFFKVLSRLDLETGEWLSIGFIIPNEPLEKRSMFDYATSVDDVEKITRLDFFNNIPKDIQKRMESTFNTKLW